ncbi:MAG: hypothetical protein HYS41_04945 [Candidatus Omnitrophica bacterium]|nr:hypothetical protein [Candidatus Omnitrophota bacterium]
MESQDRTIPCPICQRANPFFDSLNRQINQTRAVTDKVYFARKLLAKAEDVLEEHGQAGDPAGKACRAVLNLRKQAAELILKAQKLAD